MSIYTPVRKIGNSEVTIELKASTIPTKEKSEVKSQKPLDIEKVIFAAGNKIYIPDGKNLRTLFEADDKITCMALFDGKIFHAEAHRICETMERKVILPLKDVDDEFSKKYLYISSLAFDHDGNLYFSFYDTIYEVFSKKEVKKRKISDYKYVNSDYLNPIKSIVDHGRKLYDGGVFVETRNSREVVRDFGVIYDTHDDKLIKTRSGRVYALASHNGRMYDTGHYGRIYDTFEDNIIYKNEDSKHLRISPENIEGLVFDNDKMYYFGREGLFVIYRDGKKSQIFPKFDWTSAISSLIVPDIQTYENALRTSKNLW